MVIWAFLIKTASKYLDELVEIKLLEKHKIGRNVYYINQPLISVVLNSARDRGARRARAAPVPCRDRDR